MANPSVPILERSVTAQVGSTPDLQSAVQGYAESSNNLSAIGAKVAQTASNAMASQLGYESGKNPHGNLPPSFTEFDQNFAQSYHAQAEATLSQQGNELLANAEIQMSKANRLTPDLIANTHKQLSDGLAKISANAPNEVRNKLEAQFSSQVLRQRTMYTEKMITQQRQDASDNLKAGINTSLLNINNLGQSGDFKGAIAAEQAAIGYAKNARANNYMSADDERSAIETAKQARINALNNHEAVAAFHRGKFPEYAADFEKNHQGLTPTQHAAAGQSMMQQINFLQGLKSQDETLNAVRFEQEIAENVNGISTTRITSLKSEVSPLLYERLQLEYIKAKKVFNTEKAGSDYVINGFSNNQVYPRATKEQKNKAFDTLVARHINTMQQQGTPVGLDEAQAQIASTAAGAVPGYVEVLNAKLSSRNPADLETASRSVSYITGRKKGANLEGLNEKSVAMSEMYQALRRSHIPQEAADEAYKAVYTPRTEENKQILDDGWADQLKLIKDDGKLSTYADIGGVNTNNLVDPLGYAEQTESLLKANYILTNGDYETAKKMTADQIKNSYGASYVNGKKQTVFYPIEQAVGIPSDGAGYIQDDVIEFVNKELASTKAAFTKGELPFYYEVEPRRSLENARHEGHGFETANITEARKQSHIQKFEEGQPMLIHKHWKNGVRETYPLIVKADPWLAKANNATKPYTAGWDIVLGTENGFIPLTRENPMMNQFVVYKPDVAKINARYLKEHGLKE